MEPSLIKPEMLGFPQLNDTVVLFFNLGHFHRFHKHVSGSKIRSYGPVKYFTWKSPSGNRSVLGGMIGAPMAVLIVEAAFASGGRFFYSFGTTGWVGSRPGEIGTLIAPQQGLDETGMVEDYGGDSQPLRFENRFPVERSSGIVSVNSFFRLTRKKVEGYRRGGIELIDMEAVPLMYILSLWGGTYAPLLLISDYIDSGFQWIYHPHSACLRNGLEKGLQLLATMAGGR